MSWFDSITHMLTYLRNYFFLNKQYKQHIQNLQNLEKEEQLVGLKEQIVSLRGQLVELGEQIINLKEQNLGLMTTLSEQKSISSIKEKKIVELQHGISENEQLCKTKESMILAKEKKIVELQHSIKLREQLCKEKDEKIIRLEQLNRSEQLNKEKLLRNNIQLKNKLFQKEQEIFEKNKYSGSFKDSQEFRIPYSSDYALNKIIDKEAEQFQSFRNYLNGIRDRIIYNSN